MLYNQRVNWKFIYINFLPSCYIKNKIANLIILICLFTIYLLIFTLKMNKKILKLQPTPNIFDDIQRYIQFNPQVNQRKPSTTASKHSKSLYYYSYKSSATKSKNRTGVVTAQQTINAQILAQRKKPSTTQYSSTKRRVSNFSYGNQFSQSFNTTNNYNNIKLQSVAGITLNQQETKSRKERNLNSRQNFRKIKLTQIQKQNKRLSERLNSQQSNYSSKKLLKAYESQQSLSKRLSSSKLSNRSILSQNSSRSKSSASSKNSSINTPRNNQKNKKIRRKLQDKQRILSNLEVKIEEHNIHKLNENSIDKFKNLFANSFNNPLLNLKAKHQVIAKQRKVLNQQRRILKNPYVDVKLNGITQLQKQTLNKKKINSEQKLRLTEHLINEPTPASLLKQLNRPQKIEKPIRLHYQSLSLDNGQCGGLLHRIAQQMHENDKSIKNIRKSSNLGKPLLLKIKK